MATAVRMHDGRRREQQTPVGSLYARITSSKHYGLVLVSRFVSTISRNAHFVIVFKNPCDQTGFRVLGLPSLSASMARRPQTLCRVHATSLRVSHDRSSSCLRRPIPVVQSCDSGTVRRWCTSDNEFFYLQYHAPLHVGLRQTI